MSFLAGAIVGSLKLDLGGLTSGIAGAVAASATGGPEMAAPWLAAFEVIKRAAVAAFEFVVQTIEGVGTQFRNLANEAAKAGVSVEWLSALGPAAEDAGSSVGGLGDALKFLGKNATEAAEGNKEAVAAFDRLGISQADVAANLGDLEGLFGRVVDGVNGLGTSAEQTRSAMELLGRGGSDLKKFIQGGTEGIEEWRQTSQRLGATVTDENARAGEAFKKLGTITDVAWEGVKQTLAAPILDYISQHFEDFQGLIVDVSDILRNLVPPALALIAAGIQAAVIAALPLLEVLRDIAVVTDAIGATNNLATSVGNANAAAVRLAQGIDQISVNVNASFDPDEASSQVAAKLQPAFRRAHQDLSTKMKAGVSGARVAKGLGGRASTESDF